MMSRSVVVVEGRAGGAEGLGAGKVWCGPMDARGGWGGGFQLVTSLWLVNIV